MSNLRDNIQLNLIRLINERNLSQKEFAEMLGVSQAAVTNWVKGKNSPDIEVIAKICELLNISITQLIGKPQITFQKKRSMTFSQNLHNKRIEAGLSIEELAEVVGVSENTVKSWEEGCITALKQNEIIKLSEVLNVNVALLLPGDDVLSKKVADVHYRPDEALLLKNYNSLDKKGKNKLLEYLDDLISSKKYANKKNNT